MPEDTNAAAELQALLGSCGVAMDANPAVLRASGPDAKRWLNGMTTNSVLALAPGEGVYTFFLNAQGRIQGDATVYREPSSADDEHFLILTSASQAETLEPMLNRFIIMDDVELTATSPSLRSLKVIGPTAAYVVASLLPGVLAPKPLELLQVEGDLLLVAPGTSKVPQFELIGPTERVEALLEAARTQGVQIVSQNALEALRLYEGVPRYGTDIRDRDLPQETSQTQALHFNKGCYLGQEIVERIRSRGQVHRLLTRFRLDGTLPTELPAPLEAAGKPAGELTSAINVPLPEGSQTFALGYARREALETHTPFSYAGGTAHPA